MHGLKHETNPEQNLNVTLKGCDKNLVLNSDKQLFENLKNDI